MVSFTDWNFLVSRNIIFAKIKLPTVLYIFLVLDRRVMLLHIWFEDSYIQMLAIKIHLISQQI